MTQKLSNEKLRKKALSLLDAKEYKKLRKHLQSFPKSLQQDRDEFELQILTEEWVSGAPAEEVSKAFDKYLATYDKVRLSNLEVAIRIKSDLGEYGTVFKIAERIFAESPHNEVAINGVFVAYVNTKKREMAHKTAATMLENWITLGRPEEWVVDAKLKLIITGVQLSKYHEAAQYWTEVKDRRAEFPHLFASEHYACVVRALSNLGRHSDAVELIEDLDPEILQHDNLISALPNLWLNVGDKSRCYEAFEAMENSSIDPVETIWNRGLARLGFGDLEPGLDDYEIRWKWDEFPSAKRIFSSPLWMGEDLTDKRILVWGEQGIGDQLLFLTLLPIVLSKNPREVVVEVSKKIMPLVQRWYPEVTVGSDGVVDTIGHESYEGFDCNIPLGTLMQRCVSETGNIPVCSRLMRVPSSAREKLFPDSIAKKRILLGVSWRSHLVNDARVGNYLSVHSILKLREVLPEDIGFVCLQYSLQEEERQLLSEHDSIFIPEYDFFENVDMNAFYAGTCDLVLTSGTVTLQLAGIYGVPALTWLPERDWVLLGEQHYPWFNNVVVVRGAPDWNNTAMLHALIDKLKIILRIS